MEGMATTFLAAKPHWLLCAMLNGLFKQLSRERLGMGICCGGNVLMLCGAWLGPHWLIVVSNLQFSFSKDCLCSACTGLWDSRRRIGGETCLDFVEQAQLERWQGTGEPKRITMIVEQGEEAAAVRLLECLYSDCLPDLKTELDLRLNLGILMLADQYEVKAALSLCTQQLEMLTDLGMISWELADKIMRLPVVYLETPGISCLVVKIQVRRAQVRSTIMFVAMLSFLGHWLG